MERHVKERLVGAAVLVAAAVILIPEMLSGPDRGPDQVAAQPAGETPLKTYTIDLTRSPAEQSQEMPGADSIPSTEAPPPEITTEPETTAPREEGAQEDPPPQVNPESEEVASPAARPAQTAPPQVATAEPPKPATALPRPPTTQAAPTVQTDSSGGWAVQLGSFSSRATADGLEKKMQAQGYEAFVMPVKSGGATLYRVRVGPMKDRESASKALARIKATVPAAAVVKHP